MTWSDVQRSASWSGWRALFEQGRAKYAAAIEADPSAYVEHARRFDAALRASAASLTRMGELRAKLPEGERHPVDVRLGALEHRYRDLAAGFYAGARPANGAEVGAPPLILIGVIVVAVVAIAWAIVAWAYCQNLQDETALAEKELQARVEASKDGRQLPPSTLPGGDKGVGLGLILGVSAALVGVAFVASKVAR